MDIYGDVIIGLAMIYVIYFGYKISKENIKKEKLLEQKKQLKREQKQELINKIDGIYNDIQEIKNNIK